MIHRRVVDWEDAYANGTNIARGETFAPAWAEKAGAFREAMSAAGKARLDLAYGDRPRHRLDLFLPDHSPKGLVVYVHGGYWVRFDKSSWSHLASGPLAHGY